MYPCTFCTGCPGFKLKIINSLQILQKSGIYVKTCIFGQFIFWTDYYPTVMMIIMMIIIMIIMEINMMMVMMIIMMIFMMIIMMIIMIL